MKTSRELGRPGPGRTHVEFVGGPHCGERETVNVDPETMQAPAQLTRRGKVGSRVIETTYVRREAARPCLDGVSAWHYDAQRPEAPEPPVTDGEDSA